MMTTMQKFYGLVYNRRTREVTTDDSDKPSLLSKQSGKLLMLFLSAEDHTLTRDEIRLKLWGHKYVSEDVVNHAVCRLRKSLQQCAPTIDIFIETLPCTGYRLHGCARPTRATHAEQRMQRWIVLASLFSMV